MRLIRLKEVIDNTGLGRSTIYKYITEGFFPSQSHWVVELSHGLRERGS